MVVLDCGPPTFVVPTHDVGPPRSNQLTTPPPLRYTTYRFHLPSTPPTDTCLPLTCPFSVDCVSATPHDIPSFHVYSTPHLMSHPSFCLCLSPLTICLPCHLHLYGCPHSPFSTTSSVPATSLPRPSTQPQNMCRIILGDVPVASPVPPC
jgi:hypothetical protein